MALLVDESVIVRLRDDLLRFTWRWRNLHADRASATSAVCWLSSEQAAERAAGVDDEVEQRLGNDPEEERRRPGEHGDE